MATLQGTYPLNQPIAQNEQGTIIDNLAFNGGSYKVIAYFEDDQGIRTYLPANVQQNTLNKIKDLTWGLLNAHNLYRETRRQAPYAIKTIDAAGLIKMDNSIVGHDFSISSISQTASFFPGHVARSLTDVAVQPLDPAAIKAQDIWQALEFTMRQATNQPQPPPPPAMRLTPLSNTDLDLPDLLPDNPPSPSAAPLTLPATSQVVPSPGDVPAPQPLQLPSLPNLGSNAVTTPTPSSSPSPIPLPFSDLDTLPFPNLSDDVTVPLSTLSSTPITTAQSSQPIPLSFPNLNNAPTTTTVASAPSATLNSLSFVAPATVSQPSATPAQTPSLGQTPSALHTLLRTEGRLPTPVERALTQVDFSKPDWYTAIPRYQKLKIINDILNHRTPGGGIYGKVWEHLGLPGNAPATFERLKAEKNRLLSENNSFSQIPSGIRVEANQLIVQADQLRQTELEEKIHLLMAKEFAYKEALDRCLREQAEAESVVIADWDREWAKYHYLDDPRRFISALVRWLDSN